VSTKNEDGRPEHTNTTRHGALLTGKGDSQVGPDERRQGDGMGDRSHQKDPNPGMNARPSPYLRLMRRMRMWVSFGCVGRSVSSSWTRGAGEEGAAVEAGGTGGA